MPRVANEPLTWELLDYWKASGLPACTVEPAPIVVARDNAGAVIGLAVLITGRGLVPLVGLMAKNLRVGLRVMDELERLLQTVGITGYFFTLDEHSPPGWRDQVVRSGVFLPMGTQSGAEVFRRDFSRLAA